MEFAAKVIHGSNLTPAQLKSKTNRLYSVTNGEKNQKMSICSFKFVLMFGLCSAGEPPGPNLGEDIHRHGPEQAEDGGVPVLRP